MGLKILMLELAISTVRRHLNVKFTKSLKFCLAVAAYLRLHSTEQIALYKMEFQFSKTIKWSLTYCTTQLISIGFWNLMLSMVAFFIIQDRIPWFCYSLGKQHSFDWYLNTHLREERCQPQLRGGAWAQDGWDSFCSSLPAQLSPSKMC